MRWLYVPNENIEGDQIGPRMAFEKLHAEGIFSAYQAYSYLVRQKVLGSHQDALNEFLETVRVFAPDVIFIQHPGNGYPMDSNFLANLKATPNKPKLVLFEADAYGSLVKRMDATLKTVMAATDLCFLVGTGDLASLARKAGAKNIRFAPHSYDSRRFGTEWKPTTTRQFDAVMIGNLPCIKRIPWLFMPGGRGRKNMAESLYQFLGDKFAVFGCGQGWNKRPYAKGRLDFDHQDKVIRDSWVSVNWHHFDEIAMYASDRLPISLACGVPHITNYQPGYEHVFAKIPGLFVIKSPKEAVDAALYILSLPAERRNELGFKAAEYAQKHLEATVVYRDIVSVVTEQLFESEQRSIQ